jgi:hypothetical protein
VQNVPDSGLAELAPSRKGGLSDFGQGSCRLPHKPEKLQAGWIADGGAGGPEESQFSSLLLKEPGRLLRLGKEVGE